MRSFSDLKHGLKSNWEITKNYRIMLHLLNLVDLTDNCLPLKLLSGK